MDENIDERELARAPMRAHILASINRLGSSAPPSASASTSTSTLKDRSRRHRSSRRRDSADRDRDRTERTKSGSDNTGDDDSKLRPRKSKIRFKSRREKSSRDGEAEEERRRYRSREYDDDGLNDGDGETRYTRESVPEGAATSKDDSHHRRPRSQTRSTSPHDDRRHRSRRHDDEPGHRSHRSHRSHKSHRHHRSHRHRRHDEDAEPEDADADPPLDEDAAFRQSLFDAMADDEGAAFWEGVYGQPVHEYAEEASKYRAADANASNPHDAAGLSAMTDDEYAAYVRLRMWERSDEGRRHAAQKAADARRARDKDEEREKDDARERARQKQKAKRVDAAYWAEVDRSLKRGQARRQRKQWQEQRQAYSAAWAAWEKQPTVASIPWPGGVEGMGEDKEGKDKDTDEAYRQQVRSFFLGDDVPTETGLQTRLRDERVRWHPDKMQQKLGGSVDAEAMRRITAIFQVVDKLWGEMKR